MPSSTAATLACGALCSGPLTQVVHINSSIIVIIIAIIMAIIIIIAIIIVINIFNINIFNINTNINIINLNSCSIDNLAVAELLVAAGAEVGFFALLTIFVVFANIFLRLRSKSSSDTTIFVVFAYVSEVKIQKALLIRFVTAGPAIRYVALCATLQTTLLS